MLNYLAILTVISFGPWWFYCCGPRFSCL